MTLCAERFDRDQLGRFVPTLAGMFPKCACEDQSGFAVRDWTARQTSLRGHGPRTLFPIRPCQRLTSRAANTTAALWPRPRT